MARLTAEERKKLPSKDFADPKDRKYPEEDAGHAKAAEARASEFAGPKLKAKVDAKAKKVLKKGKAKPNRFTRDAVLNRKDME